MPDFNLEAVQHWMQDFMRLQADPAEEEIGQYIKPSLTRSAAERLMVYREQTWLRTDNALEQDYAATRQFMGAAAFRTLARAYMTAHPSSFVDVNRLRDGLPEFVESLEGIPNRGFVVDLLRLERAGWDVFHAPPDAAAQDPKTEPLVPVRALRLLAFQYPVLTYVRQPQQSSSTPQDNWLLIFRREFEIMRLPQTREQFQILSTLLEGGTLADWQSQYTGPVTPSTATAWLQLWIALGVFKKQQLQ